MPQPRCLGGDAIENLLSYDECIEAIRAAYRERGDGAPTKPRTSLTGPSSAGHLKGYLSILPDAAIMGGYVYSAGFPGEGPRSVLPLFDAESGELLAIMNGSAINVVKTGAVGAVGTDALARDDATVIGLLGSGKQARGQLLAVSEVRDISRVKVYSPTTSNREEFTAEMDGEVGATVEAVPTSGDAVTGADVVVTATRSSSPVFDGDDLDPGTHVTAIGQYHPDKRELDTQTISDARYVPDLTERAFQDAGSLLVPLRAGEIPDNHVHAELGSILAGRVPGRQATDELTVFDSGGTALETVAAAKVVYEKAVDQDIGQPMDL